MLDDALTGFLEEGLAIHLGTRNEQLEPNGARVCAVKVDDDREHVVAYLPRAAAAIVLADLRANGQVALAFARPVDDRACQVKGVFVSERRATQRERPLVMAQWQGFVRQLAAIGIPAEATRNWTTWPSVAVRIRVTALFNQTPGPNAGAPLS